MTRGRLIADAVGVMLVVGGVVLGLTVGGGWYLLAGLGVGVAAVTELVRVLPLIPPRDPGASA
jgi:hypothetical protein